MDHELRKRGNSVRRWRRPAAVLCGFVIACSLAPLAAMAARKAHLLTASHGARSYPPIARTVPYPRLEWPLELSGSQYAPVAWSDIAGWSADDHLLAYKAFAASSKPIAEQRKPPADPKALGTSLREPCRAAKALEITDGARAGVFRRAFPAVANCKGSARMRASSPATTSRWSRGRGPRLTSIACRSTAARRIRSVRGFTQRRGEFAQQGASVSQDRPPQTRARS